MRAVLDYLKPYRVAKLARIARVLDPAGDPAPPTAGMGERAPARLTSYMRRSMHAYQSYSCTYTRAQVYVHFAHISYDLS